MIYTLGHSNVELDEMVRLMQPHNISTVVDIRSHPSSKWEQFRKENLEKSLPTNGIKYVWLPSLGGWTKRHQGMAEQYIKEGVSIQAYAMGKFPKQRISETIPSAGGAKPAWTNVGLHDYSWFMTLDEFHQGIEELHQIHKSAGSVAIMCAESLPWKCHRSMVSDFLIFNKEDTNHIMGKKLLPHSQMLGNRLQRYDHEIIKVWQKWRAE